MEPVEYIKVDKNILDFFKVIYFGGITDPMAAASDRAYRDLNRTIRFQNMPQQRRDGLRNAVTELFRKEIPALVQGGILNQNGYDAWHREICGQIRGIYQEAGVVFYYGQAQTWINMTMKYLYTSGNTP